MIISLRPSTTALLAFGLLLGGVGVGFGFAPDGCEQQRAQYPKDWLDVAREKGVFLCRSPGNPSWRIKTGARDEAGRTLMSLVRLKPHRAIEDAAQVYRIWLDADQARRLREGRYFATIVRDEKSCWIRGSLGEEDLLLLIDRPGPADGGGAGGKILRTSIIDDTAYTCRPESGSRQ